MNHPSTRKAAMQHFFVLWLLALFAMSVRAEMTVVYPRHENGTTNHSDFYFEVLRGALERTRTDYGPYTLRYSEQGMNPSRAAAELAVGNGLIHVDVRSWTAERAAQLHPVPIPVDRGLIGYRLLLIRAADQPKFDSVRTLDDLKRFSFGLLTPWSDVRIFERNGLRVVRGTSYEGLFRMLNADRFDAFSRDIDEIQFEFDLKSSELPKLSIERTLLLRYPSARYFFVSKTLAGLKLGARIEAGLGEMMRDGSFEELFRKHKSTQLDKLNIRNRRVIQLVNPLLPSDFPEVPQELLSPLSLEMRKY